MPRTSRSLSFTSAPPKDAKLTSPKPIVPRRLSSLTRSTPCRLSPEGGSNWNVSSRSSFAPTGTFHTIPKPRNVKHSLGQLCPTPLTPRAMRHQAFTIMPSESGEYVPAHLHQHDQDTAREDCDSVEFSPAPLTRQDRKAFRRMIHTSEGSLGSPVYVEKKCLEKTISGIPPRSPSTRPGISTDSMGQLRMAMLGSPHAQDVSKRVIPRRRLSTRRPTALDAPRASSSLPEPPPLAQRNARRRSSIERSKSLGNKHQSSSQVPTADTSETTNSQSPVRRIKSVHPISTIERARSLGPPSTDVSHPSPLRPIEPVLPTPLLNEEDSPSLSNRPPTQAGEEVVAPVRSIKSLLPSTRLNPTTAMSSIEGPEKTSFLRRVKSLQEGRRSRALNKEKKASTPFRFFDSLDSQLPASRAQIKKGFRDTLRLVGVWKKKRTCGNEQEHSSHYTEINNDSVSTRRSSLTSVDAHKLESTT